MRDADLRLPRKAEDERSAKRFSEWYIRASAFAPLPPVIPALGGDPVIANGGYESHAFANTGPAPGGGGDSKMVDPRYRTLTRLPLGKERLRRTWPAQLNSDRARSPHDGADFLDEVVAHALVVPGCFDRLRIAGGVGGPA